MRILFLAPALPYPPTDGSAIRNYNLIKALSAAHGVSLLSFAADNAGNGWRENAERGLEGLRTVARPHGYRPFSLLKGLFGRDPLPVINYRSGEMAAEVSRALKDGYDAVHCSHLHMAQYVLGAGAALKVVDLHNVDSEFMHRYAMSAKDTLRGAYARLTARKLERYEAEGLAPFDLRLSVSKRDSGVFMSRGIDTAVVENGVDTGSFSFRGEGPGNLSIVFTGWMRYYANDDAARYFCSDILPLIRKHVPGAEASFVGKEPSEGLLSLGKKCGVTVTGAVSDIRPYLYGASVYVVPLRVGGGTRLKILEAMAAGVPVVSTGAGCEGLEAEPGRHLLVADTPEEFAAETARLLRDAGLRRRLSLEGRRLVEGMYSWEVIGRKLLALYETL